MGIDVLDLGEESDESFERATLVGDRVYLVGQANQPGTLGGTLIALATQDGSAIRDFGDGGVRVFTELFEGERLIAGAAAASGDGALLVGGRIEAGTADDGFLAKITADGQLDGSFGDGGSLRLNDGVVDIEVDATGRLWIATKRGAPLLSRYAADGTLDETFSDADGILTSLSPSSAGAMTLAGGGAVVVGERDDQMTAQRYGDDGVVDTAFGDAGRAQVRPRDGRALADGVVALADGSVVMVGRADDDALNAELWAAAKLGADGALDASFGDGGVSVFEALTGRDNRIGDVIRHAEGLVAVGYGRPAETGEDSLLVVRWTAAGAVDGAFGDAGAFALPLPEDTSAQGRGAVALPDGRLLVYGMFRDRRDGARNHSAAWFLLSASGAR